MSELDRRLDEAKDNRQRFERAYAKARHSQRTDDYENALELAVIYTQVLDGIIAAHVRIVLTQSAFPTA